MLSSAYLTLFASSVILDLVTTQETSLGVNIQTNATKRLMPTKASTFIDLISQSVFVDKTLLIDTFVRTPVRTCMITCPRKWGKSVNLDMLRMYLTMQVHPNGTRILPLTESPNYRLFTEGCYYTEHDDITLEKPLLISHKKLNYLREQYLGQYPVIYVSFADIPKTDEYNYMSAVGKVIANTFRHHEYMLEVYDSIMRDPKSKKKSIKLAECAKKQFKMYLDDEVDNDEILCKSIYFLSQQLHDHFKKHVFILVDDYDKNPFTEASDLIKSILNSAFKTNEYLEQGIITGTLPVEWEENIAVYYPFLDSIYNSYYGFTENEMNLIYSYYQIPQEEQKKIQYWYNGYETLDSRKIFNPSSICEYINSQQFQPYWNEVDFHNTYLSEIFHLPEYLYLLCRLIIGDNYHISLPDHASRIIKYDDLDFPNKDVTKGRFTRYLVAAGYLTLKNSTKSIYATIPNYEISLDLQDVFAVKLNEVLKKHLYNLLQETSTAWERYLLRVQTIPGELETRMQQCFRSLAIFTKKKLHLVRYDREALISYVMMTIIPSAEFNFVSFTAEENQPKNESGQIIRPPDIIISAKTIGFVIYVNNEEEDNSVNRTKQYSDVLQKYSVLLDWEDIRVITCSVKPNKDVTISSIINPMNSDKRYYLSSRKSFRVSGPGGQPMNSSEQRYKETLHNYLTQLGLV